MTRSTSSREQAEAKCAHCGHLEREHGTTGTRPCLATVGDLIDRDFCPCEAYAPTLSKAA